MELMVNSYDVAELEDILYKYPIICGVTTNPQMLSCRKENDYFEIIKSIRKVTGERKLFTQVVSPLWEEMVEEAAIILEAAGKDTYVKIPANEAGVKAIYELHAKGVRTLGTVVHSFWQGALCLMAGAEYIAPFYESMVAAGTDGEGVIAQLAEFANSLGEDQKVMAASVRNSTHIGNMFECGIQAITLNPDTIMNSLDCFAAVAFQDYFIENWEAKFGKGVKIINFNK